MTTVFKPHERQLLAPGGIARRSDEPYSSLVEEPDAPDLQHQDLAPGRARAPRISREEVYATADTLLLEGVRPTIDRVRVRLGRGSPNTINDFLDTWWAKLGSRLRDLPGREFPQLPERVAGSLQRLWNEALESAHEVLQGTLARRDEELAERARQLDADRETLERERLAQMARTGALEEALTFARTQLEEGHQRARALEQSLQQRDTELKQVKAQLSEFQQTQDAERRATVEERARLQDRYQASESRWLGEVDRARQGAKAAETAVRELQTKLSKALDERETLRSQVQDLRGQLATATAVRGQLEARLQAALSSSHTAAAAKGLRRSPKKPIKKAKGSMSR
jgi:hypothetical protein